MHVTVTDNTRTVDLEDGRTIAVPIGWYPRLAYATPEEPASSTTRQVILNEVKNLLAQGCKTLRFAQGDTDKSRSDAVQYKVSL